MQLLSLLSFLLSELGMIGLQEYLALVGGIIDYTCIHFNLEHFNFGNHYK